MRLVQSVRTGELRLEDAPAPTPGPTQVVVLTKASLISAGTERSMRALASASLMAKARARPDLVKQVIDRARSSGLRSTMSSVRSRLAEDMPLGYSGAGVITAVGEAVSGLRPGMSVATAGAPHADLQVVASNLTAPIPDGVGFDEAAFTTVGSIALNGLRLAETGPGSRVVVVGLGLVGQLTCRLAAASGVLVAGVEPDEWKRTIAESAGATVFDSTEPGWKAVGAWAGDRGADAVLITAATSSSEPMTRAAEVAGDRGVIVVVGDVGMELDRRPFYERELTLKVARSYGPGRYDPSYEELGVDYPAGHVRWTAARNMAAFLDLLAAGRLEVRDLITHRFPFADATRAYTMLEDGTERIIGAVLEYDEKRQAAAFDVSRARDKPASALDYGLIGPGRFATAVLVPAATEAGFSLRAVHSASGAGAARTAASHPDVSVAADPGGIIEDPGLPVVFVATRHDTHAALTVSGLEAGKHVFCEKPLAVTEAELAAITEAWEGSPGALMAGFNRRWSPSVADAIELLGDGGPLQIIYRVNAGGLPDDHWLRDRRMGGRLIGEGCHFIDTCSAIVGAHPATVLTLTSHRGELLLDDDFTVAMGYPDGSQAVVIYASSSSTRPGKERIEILGREHSVVIDDFQRLRISGPAGQETKRYRPADKGHGREMQVFAEVVSGARDGAEVTADAVRTTRAVFAAVESAMSGTAVAPRY